MCLGVRVSADTIQKKMQHQFEVAEGAETRLWMKSSDTSCERLRNVHVSVLDSCLSSNMVGLSHTHTHFHRHTTAVRSR